MSPTFCASGHESEITNKRENERTPCAGSPVQGAILFVVFSIYLSIVSSFFFGTGILIIGAAAILGNSPLLNIFLYGSSVYAYDISRDAKND